jgi:hypothetical protein
MLPNTRINIISFSHRIELEKTLQQCINEKDEYKEKYEEYIR